MQKLHFPSLPVKRILHSRSGVLCVVLLAGALWLLSVSPQALYRKAAPDFRASAAPAPSPAPKQQGCCANQPAVLRRMVGTYYTTEDGFRSTLVLNNKGPNQIAVTPILHGQNGQTFTAPFVAVDGESSSEVDLNAIAASAGPQFRSGSFEFSYTGRLLEMGGGLRIVNSEKSLIFDEQMLEPGMRFPSPRLEAVYAVPFDSAEVSVIVTNTTADRLAVDGDASFEGLNGHHPIHQRLGPYDTEVVKLPHGLVKKASAGAVSLSHNGGKGALLAMIHLQEPERGYSEAVNFNDPTLGKTTQLHGAGLRLGSINGDPLSPVIAVRNVGGGETTVTASVPYTKQDGSTGKISLPRISLAPGGTKLLSASSSQLRQDDFDTAGLEIEYTGAPGGVIASASSISASGNQVFVLPLKDPKGGLSSSGGYPWFINGSSSTVVFIKNTAVEPQQFILSIVYPGGQWGYKARPIAAGQTLAVDIQKLRDSQEKGSEGNAIPPNAVSGHISWGARGTAEKVLIGRAQTVDSRQGLSSTYECQCVCVPSWGGEARIVPENAVIPVDETRSFDLQATYYDCFGNYKGWISTAVAGGFSPSLFSDDTSVATFTATPNPPTGTGIGSGTTTLRATWTEQIVTYGDCDPTTPNCDCSISFPTAYASTSVTVACVVPEEETTMPVRWNPIIPNQYDYTMRLLPAATRFGGRRVYERSYPSNDPHLDSCWFPESDYPSFTQVTNPPNSFWTVRQGTNEWGFDTIGYPNLAVPYYRRLGKAPCGTRFSQVMYINCGRNPDGTDKLEFYSVDQIGADIDTTKISVTRARKIGTKNY